MRVLQRKVLSSRLLRWRKKKNFGFTIIEVIVAISIATMLMTLVIFEISHYSKEYKADVIRGKQHFYINEVLRFLDNQLKDNVKGVQVENNTLTLIKYKRPENGTKLVLYSEIDFNSVDLNRIRLSESQLQIEYSSSSVPVVLLMNVEDFQAKIMSNKLFITIKMKKGEYIKRCFDLKYIEV